MKQIKIVSDGTGYGTQIIGEDGALITGCESISIAVAAGGITTAWLKFNNVALALHARAELTLDERQDGTE